MANPVAELEDLGETVVPLIEQLREDETEIFDAVTKGPPFSNKRS